MNLRRWQEECIKQALQSYESHQHYLCLATPGAGKTIMSAALSRQLLSTDRIDLVLCFSPSVVTAQGINTTFSRVLGRRFDGKVGAVGGSYTYQSMLFFEDEFWSVLEHNRVLVVFDEIHHCSGSEVGNANAWGMEILLKVKEKATFTLALTGTPWRSDNAPLVLSRYFEGNSKIHCDYIYGLKDAVAEEVCRVPKVVLVDNDGVTVTDKAQQITPYPSLCDMLANERSVSYRHVLSDDLAIKDILARGCKRLATLRKRNPTAGGLVVASSTEHASYIHRLLLDQFEESSVLVTYKELGAAQKIERFRQDQTAWIVSVGMISEGTGIPRLQVCCHLSRVRTELYFRQVLGRILRVDGYSSKDAWLYTFAESNMIEFANRLDQEIPDHEIVIRSSEGDGSPSLLKDNPTDIKMDDVVSWRLGWAVNGEDKKISKPLNTVVQNQIEDLQIFQLIGSFRERIVDVFEVPTSGFR